VNAEIVTIQRVSTAAGEQQLRKLVQDHADLTGSAKAAAILGDWPAALKKFWQLVPPSESSTPEASEEAVNQAPAERVPATAA
jgi:glutamate synthase (ferredoxin)